MTPGTLATTDLWATYYPGKTPEQAYNEARAANDRRHELFRAVRAVTATHDACRTDADLADYWKRLAAAQAELLRHDGIPEQWINEHGHDITPAGICRGCWQPGAADIDGCGGCDHHYHPACRRAMLIRCDLRCAASARINKDEARAVMWERIALTKHNDAAREEIAA